MNLPYKQVPKQPAKALFSPVTLGTVQLGMQYGIANRSGQPDLETAFQILQAAIEEGISCFDTAYAYGRSEEVLGQFFTRTAATDGTDGAGGTNAPFIISKWGVRNSGEGDSVESVIKQLDDILEGSLSRLKLTCIPGMILHNPLVLKHHGRAVTLKLQEYVKQGLVGKVGVSLGLFVDQEFADIWPVIQDDLYELVQVPINVFDHRLVRNGQLEQLHSSGKHVFARSVFLQGLLFLEDAQLPEKIQDMSPFIAQFRRLAEREGMSLSQLAFSYVRDLPGINSLVVGAETATQVHDTMTLLKTPLLQERTRHLIQQQFANIPERFVTPSLWNQA